MNPIIIYFIIGISAIAIGIFLGKILFAKNTQLKIDEAERSSRKIIEEAEIRAETIKKERILEAKEKFVQLKADLDKETFDRNRKLSESENRIKQKEISINQKDNNIEKQLKEKERNWKSTRKNICAGLKRVPG